MVPIRLLIVAFFFWLLAGKPDATAADSNLKYSVVIPLGLEATLPVPDDNPLTAKKVELGRKLFSDPMLSKDRSLSCASCHLPNHGFAANQPVGSGIQQQKGHRNAPTLINRAFGKVHFWDGRAATLEEQALQPIDNALELGATVPVVLERLRADKDYSAGFASAFADGITATNLARAIASFERTLLSGNSRIDQFHAAQTVDLSREERQGLWLFESRARCWQCHSGNNLSDEQFHNTGVSWRKKPHDFGRSEVTNKASDRGRFKTPTLRDVDLTAPYMHDGSMATLKEVVEFYNRGGNSNEHLDAQMKPLNLAPDDIANLVAFLKALTGQAANSPE